MTKQTKPWLSSATMLFSPVTRYTKTGQILELDVWQIDKPRLLKAGLVPTIPGFSFSWPEEGEPHLLRLAKEGSSAAYYLYHNDVMILTDGPSDKRVRMLSELFHLPWLFIGRNHALIRAMDYQRILKETGGRGEPIEVTSEELDKMRHHVPLIPKPQEPMSVTPTEAGAVRLLESLGYEVFTKEDWQAYLDETAKDLVTHIEREIEDARDERRRHHVSLVNRLQRRIKHEKNRVSRGWAGTDKDNGESKVTEGTVGYDAFFIQTKRLSSNGPNEQSVPKSAPGFYRPGDEWAESRFESGAGGQDEKANGETESDKS